MWEFVSKVIYINLDHREDRRQIMQKLFNEGQIPQEKIQRFSAIKHEIGIIGCAMGHIAILKMAKTNRWNRVLILEDDLQWIDFKNNYEKLEELVSTPIWDVCMLGGHYLEKNHEKITCAFYTNAYIVQFHYYDTLINNFEKGLELKLYKPVPLNNNSILYTIQRHKKYIQEVKDDFIHNIDVYWIKLQMKDNWVGIIEPMITQVESYSDIYNTNVNHEKNRPNSFNRINFINYIKHLITNNLI